MMQIFFLMLCSSFFFFSLLNLLALKKKYQIYTLFIFLIVSDICIGKAIVLILQAKCILHGYTFPAAVEESTHLSIQDWMGMSPVILILYPPFSNYFIYYWFANIILLSDSEVILGQSLTKVSTVYVFSLIIIST